LFVWFRSFFIIIIILYVFFFIITFALFRNSYVLSRSFVRLSIRLFAFFSSFSSKELIVFAFKTINEKTNELFNKFDFLHEIINESIEWLKSNFVL
jgi:ABC-type sugar transport system permease subunit